eukprot:359013-Chlamydomonas_euryale.AAC.14
MRRSWKIGAKLRARQHPHAFSWGDHVGKWQATMHQVLPQHNVHADDVGAAVVYLHAVAAAATSAASAAAGAEILQKQHGRPQQPQHQQQQQQQQQQQNQVPGVSWAALLTTLRSLSVKLPGGSSPGAGGAEGPWRRTTANGAGGGGAADLSPRDQLLAYGVSAELAAAAAAPRRATEPRNTAEAAITATLPPEVLAQQYDGYGAPHPHAAPQQPQHGGGNTEFGMAAEMAGVAGMPLPP